MDANFRLGSPRQPDSGDCGAPARGLAFLPAADDRGQETSAFNELNSAHHLLVPAVSIEATDASKNRDRGVCGSCSATNSPYRMRPVRQSERRAPHAAAVFPMFWAADGRSALKTVSPQSPVGGFAGNGRANYAVPASQRPAQPIRAANRAVPVDRERTENSSGGGVPRLAFLCNVHGSTATAGRCGVRIPGPRPCRKDEGGRMKDE